MGYKTEINYIARWKEKKVQDDYLEAIKDIFNESRDVQDKYLQENKKIIEFNKEGARTYIIGSPIFLANHNWEIVARGYVSETIVREDRTTIKFRILNLYNEKESRLLTAVIQRGEDSMEKVK